MVKTADVSSWYSNLYADDSHPCIRLYMMDGYSLFLPSLPPHFVYFHFHKNSFFFPSLWGRREPRKKRVLVLVLVLVEHTCSIK